MTKFKNSIKKRVDQLERDAKKDKPETKTLDVLLNPIGPVNYQGIYSAGIQVSGAVPVGVYANYDLTRGFLQGLQNDDGNIDGNYCKLLQLDIRILLNNVGLAAGPGLRRVRLMMIMIPAASLLTPVDVQNQVLAYGDPAIYGPLAYCSPLKRNTTINGGYDVWHDSVYTLTNAQKDFAPQNSSKVIRIKKKFTKGLELRFSGVAGALALEQNRIFLFAYDPTNNYNPAAPDAVALSFISRIRYSDN